MLTTGFDVPDTDCAVIARPTKSQNLYKQMVGRVLRTAPNKTNAILLDCGNVIENLGMPLEPIKIIDGNEIINQFKCFKCGSTNIKLTKIDNILYWQCQGCNNLEEVKQGSYECDSCHQLHNHESEFITIENKLFLNCDCGYQTLISEYTGKEKFIEILENENQIDYLPFEEARKFIYTLKIKSKKEWKQEYCKGLMKNLPPLPNNIPCNPEKIYRQQGWTNYTNWLNLEILDNSNYLEYNEARKFANELSLVSRDQWKQEYCKGLMKNSPPLPNNIPMQPHNIYKNKGWIDYKHWLGIESNLDNLDLLTNNQKKLEKFITIEKEKLLNKMKEKDSQIHLLDKYKKIIKAINKIQKTATRKYINYYTNQNTKLLFDNIEEELKIIKIFFDSLK